MTVLEQAESHKVASSSKQDHKRPANLEAVKKKTFSSGYVWGWQNLTLTAGSKTFPQNVCVRVSGFTGFFCLSV